VTLFRLSRDCMACGREKGQPMCDLCARLVEAEQEADKRRAAYAATGSTEETKT
jgi:hypothetical protein